MPTVLRWKNYIFAFYSSDRMEPPHIHVFKGRPGPNAKFWLEDCSLFKAVGLNERELNEIRKKLVEEQEMLMEKWNEYFGH